MEVLARLPSWLKVRVIRADSGFCDNKWLSLLESQNLPYIVVAKLILSKFWATEAALSLAVVSYNLVVLFEQKLGWQEKRMSVGTLRYWLFVTAGVLGNHAGKSTLKFALPASQRPWWERLWAKLASPYPNCNAVGPAPPFACV